LSNVEDEFGRRKEMEEEKRVFTAGSDAAVEVTVKIKKRRPSANKQDQHHRRHEKPVKEALEVFPKGDSIQPCLTRILQFIML